MKRKSAFLAMMISIPAVPAAGQVMVPQVSVKPIIPPQGQVLACPPKLATAILAADVKEPWLGASATVTLIAASVRTLGQVALDSEHAGFVAPAIVVIGDVVALSDKLAWFTREAVLAP